MIKNLIENQSNFLKNKNIRFVAVFIVVLELGFLFAPTVSTFDASSNSYLASVLPAVLDDLTNQNRQVQNLPVLSVSPVLNKVAELKVDDMAQKGYFAHTSPEGKAPWFWFEKAGYNYEYAGENLAVDFTDSKDVARAWMNSPKHKANILKNAYTEIGTAIATGTYQGHATVFVAQEFGRLAKGVNIISSNQIVSESTSTQQSKVMGATAQVVENVAVARPATLAEYFKSPRSVVNIIFVIVAFLVGLVVVLKILIGVDKKHPILITNSLLVLVLILGFYVVNNYMIKNKLEKTSSFASFTREGFDQAK